MLVARDIVLTLRSRPVLRGLSAEFMPGEVTAIVGANGAGKSSLLHCLAGLIVPQSGTVLLDNAPLPVGQDRARQIAFLPQRPEIAWDVDVAHLVGLGRLPWGTGEEYVDMQAIESAIHRAELGPLVDRKAQRLSGGEQARAHLARMLAGEARWLLLDEPFAALDPAHVLAASRLLREEAARGAGVVLIVHDLTLAAHIADKIVMLKDGALLACGVPEDTLNPILLEDAFSTPMRVIEAGDGIHILPDWRA